MHVFDSQVNCKPQQATETESFLQEEVKAKSERCSLLEKEVSVRHYFKVVFCLITHWEILLDSDWLRYCEFIRDLRANSVIQGKLQISREKSAIHFECKYEKA